MVRGGQEKLDAHRESALDQESTTELQQAPASDEVRIKYKYRKLLMQCEVKLPSRLAKKLLGPDCAFRIYRNR